MNHWWREQRQWKNSCFVSLRTCESRQGTDYWYTRNKGHSGRDDFLFLSLTPFGTKHVHSVAKDKKNQGPQKKITASSFLKKQIKLSRALYTNKPSSKSNPMHVTMPSQSFAVPHTMSSILSTSPQHRVLSSRDGNHQRPHHVELSSCQESYMLFKRCSMSDKTEGYSCSDAVASYMRCALNDCQ